MRDDNSRWLQQSTAEGGRTDGARDGAEEEMSIWSCPISPLLESSMETAGRAEGKER